ncbi:MAG: hypothetical protein OEZ22_03790 [Spirochaetia bacterium]|nr:hypothetical protein [Spirochaetia bacterium]
MLTSAEIKNSNILKVGINSLKELEEKIKALRTINLHSKRKRYIISRTEIPDNSGNLIMQKGEDFDYPKTMLLKRFYKPGFMFKTFQPNEGITIVSSMNNAEGIQMTMDLVTQIMNIGGGAYEAFIDRVDSFSGLSTIMGNAIYPKLVIVGYISSENITNEINYFRKIANDDPYIRFVEVIHSKIKPKPVLEKIKTILISTADKDCWKKFILEVIKEYISPYNIEER